MKLQLSHVLIETQHSHQQLIGMEAKGKVPFTVSETLGQIQGHVWMAFCLNQLQREQQGPVDRGTQVDGKRQRGAEERSRDGGAGQTGESTRFSICDETVVAKPPTVR